jgi:hypothetical protein
MPTQLPCISQALDGAARQAAARTAPRRPPHGPHNARKGAVAGRFSGCWLRRMGRMATGVTMRSAGAAGSDRVRAGSSRSGSQTPATKPSASVLRDDHEVALRRRGYAPRRYSHRPRSEQPRGTVLVRESNDRRHSTAPAAPNFTNGRSSWPPPPL